MRGEYGGVCDVMGHTYVKGIKELCIFLFSCRCEVGETVSDDFKDRLARDMEQLRKDIRQIYG
jgi:hypothetical protein